MSQNNMTISVAGVLKLVPAVIVGASIIGWFMGYATLEAQTNTNKDNIAAVVVDVEEQEDAVNEIKLQAARTEVKLQQIQRTQEDTVLLIQKVLERLSSR